MKTIDEKERGDTRCIVMRWGNRVLSWDEASAIKVVNDANN